jgi:hypothetical protein
MKFVNWALICALSITLTGSAANRQEAKWRQITVLQATRSDVERLLGAAEDQGYVATYPLKEGSVTIDDPPKFSSLKLDLTKFRKEQAGPHTPDLISYLNDELGVVYTVDADGSLHDITYFPPSRYDHLRCREKLKAARRPVFGIRFSRQSGRFT